MYLEDEAFIAIVTELEGETQYFFRAYVELEEEEKLAYGKIEQFTVGFSLRQGYRRTMMIDDKNVVTITPDRTSLSTLIPAFERAIR